MVPAGQVAGSGNGSSQLFTMNVAAVVADDRLAKCAAGRPPAANGFGAE